MLDLWTSNPEKQARFNAVRRALEQVDGNLTLWIEPGTPIPVVSMSIDLGQQAAADLMHGLGLVPDQDGIARHDQVSMAWRNGRLVLTTNPGGPDAVHESGGFTDNEDVRQALAAMPTPNQFKAILRPAALMHHVQAFAPLLLSAEQQQRFSAYQQRVQDRSSFAFLSMDADSKGFYLDAGGLLALIAGVVIGQSTIDPQLLLQATN
jgi:hypothetical protein